MSSDSEDDFSYTNSVSVLKSIKSKDIDINEENDFNSNINITLNDSADLQDNTINIVKNDSCAILLEDKSPAIRTVTRASSKNARRNKNIILIDSPEIATDTSLKHTNISKNDSCIVLSDEEADPNSTPINIISTIDNILQKGQKKRARRTPKGRNQFSPTPRQTRQSKRIKNSFTSTIQPVTTTTEVYVVDNTNDVNVDEVNYEVSLKVFWKSQQVHKFSIRRFEKINAIFEYFAKNENVEENRLLFTIHERILTKSDTPESLNVTAATIIEGGVLSENTEVKNVKSNQDNERIELKVQLKERKHPLLISMRATDHMDVLMCQCAEELQVPSCSLKYYFDGDVIKTNDTPLSLQLEGGECIDCVRK